MTPSTPLASRLELRRRLSAGALVLAGLGAGLGLSALPAGAAYSDPGGGSGMTSGSSSTSGGMGSSGMGSSGMSSNDMSSGSSDSSGMSSHGMGDMGSSDMVDIPSYGSGDGSGSSGPTARPGDEEFCQSAMDAYEAVGRGGRGAFPEGAALAASIRASAQHAPAKVAKAAKSIAKLYANLAKIRNSRTQALRWSMAAQKYQKAFATYYDYLVEACMPALSDLGPKTDIDEDAVPGMSRPMPQDTVY